MLVASALVSAGFSFSASVAGGQEVQQPFSAIAAADGLRMNISLQGYLVVEEFVDAGAPTAQAEMGEVEGSAYAGYPWPGDSAVSVMRLAGGKVGPPVDEFPLMAQSSTSGQPESRVESGAVVLSAQSEATRSAASAQGGLTTDSFVVSNTASNAAVAYEATTGTARAEATVVAEGIRVDDVLSFAAVRSRASVVSVAAGEPRRSSELQISDAVIAGERVVIGPHGLTLAGSDLPLPRDNPLTEALAQAGVSLEHIDAVESEDGVIAAGLRITILRNVPELPEPIRLVIEVGRARAFAQGAGSMAGDALEDLTDIDSDAPSAAVEPPTNTTESAAPPAPTAGDAPQAVVEGAPAAGDSAGERTAEPVRITGRQGALTVDAALFYPILAVAGLMLILGATLVRLFGVRLLWST